MKTFKDWFEETEEAIKNYSKINLYSYNVVMRYVYTFGLEEGLNRLEHLKKAGWGNDFYAEFMFDLGKPVCIPKKINLPSPYYDIRNTLKKQPPIKIKTGL